MQAVSAISGISKGRMMDEFVPGVIGLGSLIGKFMNLDFIFEGIVRGVGEAVKILDDHDRREGEKNATYTLDKELPPQAKKAQTIIALYCNKNGISTAIPSNIQFASCYLSLDQEWSIKRLVDSEGARIFLANQSNQIACSAYAESSDVLSPLLNLLIKEFTTAEERLDGIIPDITSSAKGFAKSDKKSGKKKKK